MASRRLGRVEKGQPLILGANKMEGGYNFAVEASEDSEVSLLLYKKRGAASPVEIVFPKDFHTGRVWALKLCSASLKDFEYNYKIDGERLHRRPPPGGDCRGPGRPGGPVGGAVFAEPVSAGRNHPNGTNAPPAKRQVDAFIPKFAT